MKSNLTRQIHLIMTTFSLAAWVNNVAISIIRKTYHSIIELSAVATFVSLVIFLLLCLLLIKGPPRVNRIVQVFHVASLALIALIATLDEYDSIYGVGFFFLGGILAMEYKLVRRNNRLAITIYFLVIAVVAEYAAITGEGKVISMAVLIFLVYLYAIVLTVNNSRVRSLVMENDSLKGERDDFKFKFAAAADVEHFIDLPEILSKRQMEIARIVYSSQKTDKENAYDLGISVNTYRNHLKELRKIMQVTTKVELLNRIRPYFLAKETDSIPSEPDSR